MIVAQIHPQGGSIGVYIYITAVLLFTHHIIMMSPGEQNESKKNTYQV